jgi:anaerobic selenocysteine-containing dehydrogenase
MQEFHTYCRNCQALCGMTLGVDNNRIISAKSDRLNPYSQGYFCSKGVLGAEFSNGVGDRLVQCMKRRPDGLLHPIDKHEAVGEIAEKLRNIIERHGPRALGLFFGTASYFDCVGRPLFMDLLHKLGSPNLFSTLTIDQSSKTVAATRMGIWMTGRPVYDQCDVLLMAGTNPLVSHQGWPLNPFPGANVHHHVRQARQMGIKMIVIDPRRTELAVVSDLFIQPRPGTDAAIFASLLREVLANGWEDSVFARRWTTNLERLRAAVAPFSCERVARYAGVSVEDLRMAARWLGAARKPGIGTGTGVDMGPHCNVAEHLVEALTALTRGYVRAGDKISNPGMLSSRVEVETVLPPDRPWERGPRSASDSRYGRLLGEFPASLLPDEILNGGEHSIRAMIVDGGNPIACLGEPERVAKAFRQLELLICIEPRLFSATAQLSHYVIAPTLQFERSEVTAFSETMFPMPFAQFAAKAVEPPPQTMGEDEFVWELAKRLGIQLSLKNVPFGADFDTYPIQLPIDMNKPPVREDLIEWMLDQSPISLQELKANPHGLTREVDARVRSPGHDDGVRLDLCPTDVAEEISAVAEELETGCQGDHFLLISRRVREVINTAFHENPKGRRHHEVNWLYVHPSDMTRLGIQEQDGVAMEGAHGSIVGYAKSDPTLRPGTVAMTHCWASGQASNFLGIEGGHTSVLVSLREHLEPINRMPLQTSISVRLQALGRSLTQVKELHRAAQAPG